MFKVGAAADVSRETFLLIHSDTEEERVSRTSTHNSQVDSVVQAVASSESKSVHPVLFGVERRTELPN